jgi:predicted amidophosphoribosyltransferase
MPAKPMKVKKTKEICLKCDRKFKSTGDHNRICDKCNAENSREARIMHKTSLNSEGDSIIKYA